MPVPAVVGAASSNGHGNGRVVMPEAVPRRPDVEHD
jgi:hypothetical protein